MKKYSLIISGFLLLVSCVKEKTPSGLVLEEGISTKDTTYVTTTIPAADPKVILFEEFTGVGCSNCPSGAATLKTLSKQNPGRILSVGIYSPFLNEYQPGVHVGQTHDFNHQDAIDLENLLGGVGSKPRAAIDRIISGDLAFPYYFPSTTWSTNVNILLSKKNPVNIALESLKNGSEYILKSKLSFTDTVTSSLAMSVYLLEDSIINWQDSSGINLPNYTHNHVLVKILTPLSGSVFLNDIPTKEKGRVFERSFTFSLPSTIVNKAHCKLLCFVHKVGSVKEVLQSAEVELEE